MMMSSSNQPQQGQQQRRFVKCGEKTGATGCGQLITFDKSFRGKNGGWVPLDEVTDAIGQKTLQPHKCSAKKPYNPNEKSQEQAQQQQQPQQQEQQQKIITTTDLIEEIHQLKEEIKLLRDAVLGK